MLRKKTKKLTWHAKSWIGYSHKLWTFIKIVMLQLFFLRGNFFSFCWETTILVFEVCLLSGSTGFYQTNHQWSLSGYRLGSGSGRSFMTTVVRNKSSLQVNQLYLLNDGKSENRGTVIYASFWANIDARLPGVSIVYFFSSADCQNYAFLFCRVNILILQWFTFTVLHL